MFVSQGYDNQMENGYFNTDLNELMYKIQTCVNSLRPNDAYMRR